MNKIPVEIVEHIISFVNCVHPCAELIKEHFSNFYFRKRDYPTPYENFQLPNNVYWNMNENMDIVGIYSIDRDVRELGAEISHRMIIYNFGRYDDDDFFNL